MYKNILFKILRITGGVIFGLFVLVVAGFFFIASNLCEKVVVAKYSSPNGAHEAVYTEKQCGAISEDVGSVMLDGKEVVRARLGGLKIQWANDYTLSIEYSGIKVGKLIKEHNGVDINFQQNALTMGGVWGNPDGAELTLEENGQFEARLPQEIFWRKDQPGLLIGKGTWTINEKNSPPTVELYFDKVSDQPRSLGIPVYISSDRDYLYQWTGEEGEGMYKLEKNRLKF
jgi:hypothetical protein